MGLVSPHSTKYTCDSPREAAKPAGALDRDYKQAPQWPELPLDALLLTAEVIIILCLVEGEVGGVCTVPRSAATPGHI